MPGMAHSSLTVHELTHLPGQAGRFFKVVLVGHFPSSVQYSACNLLVRSLLTNELFKIIDYILSLIYLQIRILLLL